MARVEKTIEVDVPVRTAYDQWTQFEEFPRFMEGVEEVRQLDDRRLHWKASIGGQTKEWDAEIREQVPDQKIIWLATSGPENAGMVKFDSLGSDKTRVHLEMSYDPEGFTENVGSALGFVSRRVQGDLERFKDLIEARGRASGAWRGEISNPDVPGGHTRGSLDAGEPGRSQGDELRAGTARMPDGSLDRGTRMERGGGTPGQVIGHGRDDTGMSHGSGAGYVSGQPTAGNFGPGYSHSGEHDRGTGGTGPGYTDEPSGPTDAMGRPDAGTQYEGMAGSGSTGGSYATSGGGSAGSTFERSDQGSAGRIPQDYGRGSRATGNLPGEQGGASDEADWRARGEGHVGSEQFADTAGTDRYPSDDDALPADQDQVGRPDADPPGGRRFDR